MVDFFVGELTTTVDAKGRVILPSVLRKEMEFENGEEASFVVYYDDERECLELYIEKRFHEEFIEPLNKISRFDVAVRNFYSRLGQNSAKTKMDNQGRIKLPKNLLEKAKIDKDVILIGALFKIEIWDPTVHQAYVAGSPTTGEMARQINEKVEKLEKSR